MENIREAMEWDIIFDNCWWQWLIFVTFFVLAFIMRHSKDKLRRRSGTVLISLGIPGMLLTVISLGMFIFHLSLLLRLTDPVTHVLDDIALHDMFGYDYYRFVNLPYSFIPFSLLLIAIQSIASMVTGISVLRNGKGKAIGIVTVFFGIAFLVFSVVFMGLFIRSFD